MCQVQSLQCKEVVKDACAYELHGLRTSPPLPPLGYIAICRAQPAGLRVWMRLPLPDADQILLAGWVALEEALTVSGLNPQLLWKAGFSALILVAVCSAVKSPVLH